MWLRLSREGTSDPLSETFAKFPSNGARVRALEARGAPGTRTAPSRVRAPSTSRERAATARAPV